jgi:hypothetical protein
MKVITQGETQRLLAWIKVQQPRVYAGLLRRFTPPQQAQVAGIWDSITGAVSSISGGVTNFLNSQGADKLLSAAQPFLQNQIEKDQLKLNLRRLQAGLPIQTYPTTAAPAASTTSPAPAPAPSTQPTQQIPWGWIGGGALAIGLLLSMR